eukprot:CAMPEP_0119329296 /NCGR_PEP_ID=MMETSP1333-20130426/75504_1 /TAXON_ID=418940 /ORGANISM="Scyphosphaera apsteinii, Strain RCC1455" /LENGTH=37 /DNA_ID= /DNA_START= /DNA_END= /DNA_ORIENTATION=
MTRLQQCLVVASGQHLLAPHRNIISSQHPVITLSSPH